MILCFVFAAVLSIDAFSVGFVTSLSGGHFPWKSRLIIAAISAFYASLAVFAGDFFIALLSAPLENTVGGSLLVITGIGIFLKALFGKESMQEGACICTPKEALVLGFALSVDMLGAGTGYAIGDGLPLYFPLAAGFSQLLMLCIGIFVGKTGKKIFKNLKRGQKAAEVLPPIFIIIIGIMSFFR